MESALDVLSRAATMVQDNANDSRLTSKELPTTAWRRERRLRTGEYHHPNYFPSSGLLTSSARASSPSSSPPPTAHVQHSPNSSGSLRNKGAHHLSIMMAAAASMRPLNESASKTSPSPPPHPTQANQMHFGQLSHTRCSQDISPIESEDAPLDMSVANLKQRNSPPPPYREPLPGSQFASSLVRPSVITQAPPKRDTRDSILVANREKDNRSCESIDEHFRRSLGDDYFSLFSKTCPAVQSTSSSHQPNNLQPPTAHMRSSSPTLPVTCRASVLPSQQPELTLPPAYPINSPSTNSQHAHQQQAIAIPKTNEGILSSGSETTTSLNSPPLPLVVRSTLKPNQQHTHVLQNPSALKAKTPTTSPQSAVSSAGIKMSNTAQSSLFNASVPRTASPMLLQQQASNVMVPLSHIAPLDNSPSSSPRNTPPVHNSLPNPSQNLPAIIRIKTEPGTQNIKSNNPTPPASPTSTTNHINNSSSTCSSSNTSSPASPKTLNWKSTNPTNTTAEVLASVDDHFAKALGETWKKLQENKEMRK